MRQHKAWPLPHRHLHLFCPAFMPSFFFTSFFVSPSTPIWCVWTRPLSANSPPWTPSAARLSTVSWARLLVSGIDVAVRSPVQRGCLLPPAIIFHWRQHWQRRRDKKLVCQGIALRLFDFQPVITNSWAPRQNYFLSQHSRYFKIYEKKQDIYLVSPQTQINDLNLFYLFVCILC